jgi:hypothetical protein
LLFLLLFLNILCFPAALILAMLQAHTSWDNLSALEKSQVPHIVQVSDVAPQRLLAFHALLFVLREIRVIFAGKLTIAFDSLFKKSKELLKQSFPRGFHCHQQLDLALSPTSRQHGATNMLQMQRCAVWRWGKAPSLIVSRLKPS